MAGLTFTYPSHCWQNPGLYGKGRESWNNFYIHPPMTVPTLPCIIYWSISNGLCQALRRPQTVGDTSWHHLPCGLTTRRLSAWGPVDLWPCGRRVVHPVELNSGGRRALQLGKCLDWSCCACVESPCPQLARQTLRPTIFTMIFFQWDLRVQIPRD